MFNHGHVELLLPRVMSLLHDIDCFQFSLIFIIFIQFNCLFFFFQFETEINGET